MKTTILATLFLFLAVALSSSIMAESGITESIKNLKTDYSSNQAIDTSSKNEILLARRSGGRSGGRSFSSRRSSSSGSSTRSTGSSYGSSSRSSGSSYGSRRSGGSNFIYVGGGSRSSYGSNHSSGVSIFAILIVLLVIGLIIFFVIRNRRNNSDGYVGNNPSEDFNTLKLQFALHANADDFRNEITTLAEELDYDREEDLKSLVNETSMLLVQNQDYIKYAFVKQGKETRNIDAAEREFDSFINEETAKFSQITFQNRGGKVRERDLSDENKPDFMEVDEYFIISLVVSYANTKIKLKDDNYSWEEYSELLRNVASISSNNVVAAEIIWSPDAKDDILTEDDIITHYPYMIQL
jgi:uncharacterized membrane protein